MKKENTKSTVNQELWRQVYDPIAGKKVMYNIYPLMMQSQNLKGKKRIIAKYMEEDLFSSVCSLLDIHEPDVEYSSKGFPSKTMAAMYSFNDDTIYVNKNPDISFGCKLLGIASTLRVAWQYKRNPSYYTYIKPRSRAGIEEYNRQKPIVDMTAFGCIALSLLFGYDPILPLSDSLIDAIKKRKELIYKELISAGKIKPVN